MARRVFFSFHYQEDYWRVNQVRNSWVTQRTDNRVENAKLFFDGSLWESVKSQGAENIKRVINEGLKNTSVTVVLIGGQTFQRRYVKYELERSYERNNGLLGVYISGLRNRDGNLGANGPDPFDHVSFANSYPVYDWVGHKGYENFSSWVEQAAIAAGR
jgi:hypothetical protein